MLLQFVSQLAVGFSIFNKLWQTLATAFLIATINDSVAAIL
jgi:hypothetical protein